MKRALYACFSVWILIFLLEGCAITPQKPDQILPGNYNFGVPLWCGGKSNFNLIPISETEAVTMGIGRHSGETMRVIDVESKRGLTF